MWYMKKGMLIDDLSFWEDNNIIYCKINSDFKANSIDESIEEIFYKAISILSRGKYMPVLIDMRLLNFSNSIKLFKFLTSNKDIKELVLSKTFLVDSYVLKLILVVYSFIYNPIIPDTIFKNIELAIKKCHKNNLVFNALN